MYALSKGLIDEQQKVRTITALAIAALAEAATPYGIESFDSVLKPLWKGIRQHRGKVRVVLFINLFTKICLEKLMFVCVSNLLPCFSCSIALTKCVFFVCRVWLHS